MGLTYNVYLDSDKIFGCRECKAHLADYNDIISRVGFSFYFLFELPTQCKSIGKDCTNTRMK